MSIYELNPDTPLPSCHACGAQMFPLSYKCLSCHTTTNVENANDNERTGSSPEDQTPHHRGDLPVSAAKPLVDGSADSEINNASDYYHKIWIKEHPGDSCGDWPIRMADAYTLFLRQQITSLRAEIAEDNRIIHAWAEKITKIYENVRKRGY